MTRNLKASLAGVCAALALGVAAPAFAGTPVDSFTSFTGVNGAGGFSYGGVSGSTFSPFLGGNGCTAIISDTICLNGSAGGLPGAFKTTTGAHQSGTVIVPANALILHPGADDDSAYVSYTATSSSQYNLGSVFTVQDNSPSGVGLSYFTTIAGVTTITTIGGLTGGSPTLNYLGGAFLNVGDSFGFIVDKAGSYFNDSTGVQVTVTAVPEPAMWAMMVGGFGLIGFGLRRRKAAQGQTALA